VFFLSVEAIKVPNLLKLRDKVLLPLEQALHPSMVEIKKLSWTTEELDDSHRSLRHFFFSHLCAGLVGTALLFGAVARLSTKVHAVVLGHSGIAIMVGAALLVSVVVSIPLVFIATGRALRLHPFMILFVVALYSLNPLILLPMMLGEVMHQLSQFIAHQAINLVEFIDERTPPGTIGILGFLLVCIGKLVQVLTHLRD